MVYLHSRALISLELIITCKVSIFSITISIVDQCVQLQDLLADCIWLGVVFEDAPFDLAPAL